MALVAEIALGVYLGVLTGVFAALLVFALAFAFQYIAGVNFPAMFGMIIGLGAAGLQGGIRVFIRDPNLLRTTSAVVALLIVLMTALYAHQKGQKLGKELPPKSVVLGTLRRNVVSRDVVKGIGTFGRVTVRPTGEVADMEGYLPLPDAIRTAIRNGEWTYPADLPIPELEKRLGETLKNEHDLADVAVRIDARGRATITAAPPESGLSRRVPEDRQVVAVEALLPVGLAPGDEVRLGLDGRRVDGRVVGVTADQPGPAADGDESADDAGEEAEPPATPTTSPGGAGRVAVAVDPDDVSAVVEGEVTGFSVRSRGRNREYELVSLLRREGNGFETLTLHEGALADRSLGEAGFRESYGVAVLAIKRAEEWLFAPDGTTELRVADELFVTGPRDGLAAFREAVA